MAEVEMSLRHSSVAPAVDYQGRRSRPTLADISRDLQPNLIPERRAAEIDWPKVAIATYTLLRILANLYVVALMQPSSTLDALARPVVTGFGLYWFRDNERYSPTSQLHVLSWRLMLLLAFPVCDPCVFELSSWVCHQYGWCVLRAELLAKVVIPWEVICNVIQVYMTNMKLDALGWHITAQRLNITTRIGFGIAVVTSLLASIMILLEGSSMDWFVDMLQKPCSAILGLCFLWCPVTLIWQFSALILLCHQSSVSGKGGRNHQIRGVVFVT